jgi:hypothetical protein
MLPAVMKSSQKLDERAGSGLSLRARKQFCPTEQADIGFKLQL